MAQRALHWHSGASLLPRFLRGRFSNAVLQLLQQRDVQAVVIGGRKGLYRHKDAFTVERELLLDQSPVPVMVVK